jgi:WD40 repeat protein
MHALTQSGSPSFSADSSLLATCGSASVFLFEVETGRLIRRFRAMSHLSSIAMDPAGTRVAAKSTSGRIKVFDLEGNLLMDAKNQKEGEGSNLFWTPDGEGLVDGSWDGLLTVRSAATGEVMARTEAKMVEKIWFDNQGAVWSRQSTRGERPRSFLARCCLPQLQHSMEAALTRAMEDYVMSPDLRYRVYLLLGESKRLVIQDMQNPADVRTIEASHYLANVAFSPDGELMLTGAVKHEYRLYRLSDLLELGRWEVRYTSDCAFSPDGRWMAMGGWGKGFLVRVPEPT